MATFAQWVRGLLRWPSRLLRRTGSLAPNEPAHPFDVAHGVETSGLFYADRLPSGHAHDRHSEGYYATAPSLFHGALAHWQAVLPAGLQVEDYAFVDLGCGKGRVVLMASQYRFRRVRGIELNARLVRVARENVRQWQRDGRALSGDVAVARGDVLGRELDAALADGGPLVLFLFNSFGAEIVSRLMNRLAAHGRSAPIDLIYVHPEQEGLVAATPGTELLRHAEIRFSWDDARADLFGVPSDVCSVWRIQATGNREHNG